MYDTVARAILCMDGLRMREINRVTFSKYDLRAWEFFEVKYYKRSF